MREERKETGDGDRPNISADSLFSQGHIQAGTHSGSVGIPGSLLSTEMQWNRLVVNLWSKMSLFCSMKEGVSYLFLSATTYLLFCHVQPPPRSAVPHVCCRPSNGRKMQALTAVEWLTAVRYETDGRLANGWTDGLPENRLTGLGAGLPLTFSQHQFQDLKFPTPQLATTIDIYHNVLLRRKIGVGVLHLEIL